MKLFRARAHMGSAMILKGPIHLDALLVWSYCHANGYHGSDNFIRPDSFRLPILCLYAYPGGRKDWVWCASAGQITGPRRYSKVSFVKKRNAYDDSQMIGNRSQKSGPWRDWFENHSALLTPTVDFLAYGHIEASLELLDQVTSLGCLRRQGFGQVMRWEIEEVDGDPLEAVVKDGRSMRSIPVSLLSSVESSKMSVCAPPYHHKQREQEACRVQSKVELKPEIVKTWTRQINEPVRRTNRRRRNRFRRALDAKKLGGAPTESLSGLSVNSRSSLGDC